MRIKVRFRFRPFKWFWRWLVKKTAGRGQTKAGIPSDGNPGKKRKKKKSKPQRSQWLNKISYK